MKSPIGLFAFWSYNRFPYVLGGPIQEMVEGGYIKATNYGSSCFDPIKILPESEGEELLLKLEELRQQHKKALDQVNDEFKFKLKSLAPFENKMIEYTIDDLYEMNLKQYKIGTVVHVSTLKCIHAYHIGHIVGFGSNAIGEIILKIKFADGDEISYHPKHVAVL